MGQDRSEITALTSEDVPSLLQFSRDVASVIYRPIAETKLVIGNESALARAFSWNVVNRNGIAKPGLWVGLLAVTATANTPPGGSQTLSVTTGTVLATVAANQLLWVCTDINGNLVVNITLGSVGTRYAAFRPLTRLDYTSAVWT